MLEPGAEYTVTYDNGEEIVDEVFMFLNISNNFVEFYSPKYGRKFFIPISRIVMIGERPKFLKLQQPQSQLQSQPQQQSQIQHQNKTDKFVKILTEKLNRGEKVKLYSEITNFFGYRPCGPLTHILMKKLSELGYNLVKEPGKSRLQWVVLPKESKEKENVDFTKQILKEMELANATGKSRPVPSGKKEKSPLEELLEGEEE